MEFFPPQARRDVPAVTGELLDGAAFDLADWNGRVVVMNWWGSWCAPCRAEAEDLLAVYDATHELGVEFLGVNVRDGRDAAAAFVDAFGHAWPSLFVPYPCPHAVRTSRAPTSTAGVNGASKVTLVRPANPAKDPSATSWTAHRP